MFSIYTEEIIRLKNNFLRTLKDDWELQISFCGKTGAGHGDFGTPGFVHLVRRKMERLAESVRKYPGDIVIWADMDIQFFGKCTPLLLRALKDRDLVIQSEWWPKKNINSGFMAMRCNPITAAFLDSVLALDFKTLPYFDQTAVEKCLYDGKTKINWDILPWQFWARSHGWPPPVGIVLHHANCTKPFFRHDQKIHCLPQKLEQLEQVRMTLEKRLKYAYFFSIEDRLRRAKRLFKLSMGTL